MPVHMFKCVACGKTFEVLVLDKSEIINCPSCKSRDLEKQPTTFNSVSSKSGDVPPSCSGGICPRQGTCGYN